MHLPTLRLSLAMALSLVFAAALPAQKKDAKEKSPADVAGEAFIKLREEKDVPPTPARQAAIMTAGIDFLKTYPTNYRANRVIDLLATFGTTMKEKNQAPQRVAWLSKLQYEILRVNLPDDAPKAAPAALKALAAAAAGQLVKEAPTKDNLMDYRDKIDRLAEMPEKWRFLSEQEKNFIQVLKLMNNLPVAEKHATALLNNPDERVAKMAQEELNLIQIARQPLELAFPTLDGKTVELATLRGKPVFYLLWATTNEASLKEIEAMAEAFDPLPAAKFEVVLVNCDPAENREAVEKYVKKNRLKQKVWFAGTGMSNELAAKLNVTKLPATAVFDQKGLFVWAGNKVQGSPGQLKKLLGIK